ncbi:MAG: hypothetical protein ACQEP1_05755, partial [Nanobdellota archaeon]
ILEQEGYFRRSTGKIDDKRVDASLLGLVWPFNIVDKEEPRMKRTIELIGEKLTKDKGVYRYEHDEYDGWMYKGYHRKKGAGYWPVLNFWMTLITGDRRYYDKVMEDLKGELIPEQIFDNELQVSVKPLGWSHAMYILAKKRIDHED